MNSFNEVATTSNAANNGLLAALLAFIGVFVVIIAIAYIFQTIALALLFKKSGKPWWAAIIPFYNRYILLDMAGYNWYYVFVYIIPILMAGTSKIVTVFMPAQSIVSMVVFFVTLIFNIKIAKSFGLSVGYGIGLTFVPVVFIPILAFNKSIQYVGPVVKGDIDFNDLF